MHELALFRRSMVASALLVALAVGLVGCAASRIDRKADDVLVAMANKLATAKQLTIQGERTVDPGFIPGAAVPQTADITAMVGAADRFAAHVKGSGIDRKMWYDGDEFTLLDVNANAYATVPAPETMDELFALMEAQFGYAPPLADFVMNDPYLRLTKDVLTGTYVGREYLGGIQYDHLAFTEADRDWELWVSVDDHLPAWLAIVAKGVGAQPEMRLSIALIDLDVDHPDETFEFAPPPGARVATMFELVGE